MSKRLNCQMQYLLHVNGAGPEYDPGKILHILRSDNFILLEAIYWCLFFVQRNILRYGSEDNILTGVNGSTSTRVL